MLEGPGTVTSLDARETKSQPVHGQPGSVSSTLDTDVGFRHSGWQHNRSLIRAALARVDAPPNRLARWDCCGSHAWVVRHPEDRTCLRVISDLCHDRFCRPCANARARLLQANLRRYLVPKPYRLLTLTLHSTTEPLSDLLRKLYKCFARLRRVHPCKGRMRGGVAFLEVKWSERHQRWHPHLHVVYEGTYIPQQQISEAWRRITGDSYIVDIRKLTDHLHATRYVAKYVSKPLSNTYLNRPDRLDEAILALSGRRTCTTFGTWRGWPLFKTGDKIDWVPVAPLCEIREKAQAGVAWAQSLLRLLQETPPWHGNPNRGPPESPSL